MGGADSLRRPSILGKKEINEENLGLKLVTSDSTILEIYHRNRLTDIENKLAVTSFGVARKG